MSDLPDQVATAVTSIDGTNFIIDWTAPEGNFASIVEYEVVIEDSTENYVTDSTNCDGQDPTVTQCTIPMSDMITLTGLSQGDLVVARVRARNANGWAQRSQENVSGAVIEVAPHKIETVAYDVENSGNT